MQVRCRSLQQGCSSRHPPPYVDGVSRSPDNAALASELRAALRRHGDKRVARELGVSRLALCHLALELPVVEGTRFLVSAKRGRLIELAALEASL